MCLMSYRLCRRGRPAAAALFVFSGMAAAQPPAVECVQPLCVNRADDDAGAPAPGMLRYAVLNAKDGAIITFDPALNGKVIEVDSRSRVNHIKIAGNLSIQGPGASLLSIDGGAATRIFFVSGGNVQISGLTLMNGLAKGGDGGAATGGAGGGGGAAGLGGAIFLNSGFLTLNGVVLSGNRGLGGNGGGGGGGFGAGRGGGGGGFGGNSVRGSAGGPPHDLKANAGEGAGGIGGGFDNVAEPGVEGGWGGGGGGGGFAVHSSGGRGAPGGASGFAGGVGGAGGFLDADAGGSTRGSGGHGGSALGGAIFVRSGELHLRDTSFVNNKTTAGIGGDGAPNGIAKGGALFICSSSYCGSGHDGKVLMSGKTLFSVNSAVQAGEDPTCDGRDDADVCGVVTPTPAANESKHSR